MAKGRKKPSKKTPAPKKRKAKPSAPRTRDFKAEYQRRIAKALAAGKTRQAARGHKPKEHIIRREREVAEAGVSASQLRSIRSFLARFNPIGFKEMPDKETLVEFVQERDYAAFQQYRKIWDTYRREYLKAKAAGTLDHNGSLGYQLDFITSQAGVLPQGEDKWLYYH